MKIEEEDSVDFFVVLSDYVEDKINPFIYLKSGFNYGGKIKMLTVRYVILIDRKTGEDKRVYISEIKHIEELRE